MALLISAVWLSPRLAFWALIVLPVGLFPIGLIAKRTLARSYQGEGREAHDAVEKGRRYFDELIEMTRMRSLAVVVLESLAGLGIVVAIVVGGFEMQHGALSCPALLAFLLAMRALHGPLNNRAAPGLCALSADVGNAAGRWFLGTGFRCRCHRSGAR